MSNELKAEDLFPGAIVEFQYLKDGSGTTEPDAWQEYTWPSYDEFDPEHHKDHVFRAIPITGKMLDRCEGLHTIESGDWSYGGHFYLSESEDYFVAWSHDPSKNGASVWAQLEHLHEFQRLCLVTGSPLTLKPQK